jgi:hypothetical protein
MSRYGIVGLALLLWACEAKETTDYEGVWQITLIETENRKQVPVAYWIEKTGENFSWGDGDFPLDSGRWVWNEDRTVLLLESANGREHDTEWNVSWQQDTLLLNGTPNKSSSHKRVMWAVKVKERPLHFRDKIIGKWRYDEVMLDSVALPPRDDAWISFSKNQVWYTAGDTGVWEVNPFAPILTVADKRGKPINEWFLIVGQDSMRLVGTSTFEQDNVEAKLTRF